MSTVNLIKIFILNNCYSLLLIFIEIYILLIFSHHKFLRFNSSLKSLCKIQSSSFQNVLKIYQYCAILNQNELKFKVQLQWIPVVQHLFWVFPLKCFVQSIYTDYANSYIMYIKLKTRWAIAGP